MAFLMSQPQRSIASYDTFRRAEPVTPAKLLEMQNRFAYHEQELKKIDIRLQQHFLPLIEQALSDKNPMQADEWLRQLPVESAAFILARDLVGRWERNLPPFAVDQTGSVAAFAPAPASVPAPAAKTLDEDDVDLRSDLRDDLRGNR